MAPEYLMDGLITTKSDMFSLGVIIMELLIGSRDYPQSSEAPFGHFVENVSGNSSAWHYFEHFSPLHSGTITMSHLIYLLSIRWLKNGGTGSQRHGQ